ncbi:protoporphyrinogen/coproporphyrinogen oxidase [Microbacterium dauci]|uniref:FAD-dependent oxidoreductase n=1 Tax=Microbacterium dauci TaxID=3048008 RepID=A0ABT6ZDT0_9MICO|nr:FAD-dependent oxidoreductase [Microbacterium sp. LX3-4]MDJ1114321.1 FAD-dependent oxidoreductase [Microbacterium sp. LX3-4]
MTSDAAADLVSHATHTRVVVVGGGLAGLVAALECARVGMAVTVLEADARVGGLVGSADLDGVVVDTVADGYRVTQGVLADLIADLGLSEHVVPARDADTWVAGPFGVAPMPAEAILGIPSNPFDERTRRIIGWAGAWRAYLDRLRPPLTIGAERSLGALVRSRLGARVVDRMVAPLTFGVHGVDPDEVDVDAAARGLNQALTRTGSLTGAVAQLGTDAAPARATLRGGMSTLITALVTRLIELGAEVRVGVEVTELAASDDGWTVTAATEDGPERIDATAVVVATPEAPARRLLAAHVPEADGSPLSPDDVDVVTLLVDGPALDAAPRGHAVYAVPGTAAALSVVHATATWPHASGDPHVIRVTLPASGRSDIEVIALARAAAAELLGADLSAVRGGHRVVAPRALPSSATSPARDALREATRSLAALAVVGAWVGGNGLARVAAGAMAESERLRSALLWGSSDEGASR